MEKDQENRYNNKTTVPILQFNYRKHSEEGSIIAVVFAKDIEKIDRFLFFQRWVYHCFEPHKKTDY
jgi:hypothetical protein